MSRRNRGRRAPESELTLIGLSETAKADTASDQSASDPSAENNSSRRSLDRRTLIKIAGGISLLLLLGLGVMARNGWLPRTDGMTGRKTGWFGRELPRNSASSWNPLVAPLPTATPQLSKEYIYAGSRLLAIEDANANAAPPADLAVWRPSDGNWYVLGSQGQTIAGWGMSGDIPVPGDYDGDGKTDFAVMRLVSGYYSWFFAYSSGGTSTFNFGTVGDKPAVGDYDGDGKTDAAIWRNSDHTFNVLKSSTQNQTNWVTSWGSTGDEPAVADYDGDGKADPSLWRDSTGQFFSLLSTTNYTQTQTVYMGSGVSTSSCPANANCIVSGDYDGDGKANYAIRQGTSADWKIMNSSLTSVSTTTPTNDLYTDFPVPNDYDGDGKCDIAVWRSSNGNWFIRKSASGGALRGEQWGSSGDIPVPSYYRR